MTIIFIAFILLGVFMLALPRQFWMLTEQWKSGDATEPSTFYVISTRCGGGVVAMIGILGILGLISAR